MTARTDYAAGGLSWRVQPGLWIDADAAFGRTNAPAGFLRLSDPALTSLLAAVRDRRLRAVRLALRLRPDRDFPTPASRARRFRDRPGGRPRQLFSGLDLFRAALLGGPGGRQIDFRLSAERAVGGEGEIGVEAFGSLEPGHVRGAAPDYGLRLRWSRLF